MSIKISLSHNDRSSVYRARRLEPHEQINRHCAISVVGNDKYRPILDGWHTAFVCLDLDFTKPQNLPTVQQLTSRPDLMSAVVVEVTSEGYRADVDMNLDISVCRNIRQAMTAGTYRFERPLISEAIGHYMRRGHTAAIMPPMDLIPPEFRNPNNLWQLWQSEWFFNGLNKKSDCIPQVKDGLSTFDVWTHLKEIQYSTDTEHNHKCAAIAYLASLWFTEVPSGIKGIWDRAANLATVSEG